MNRQQYKGPIMRTSSYSQLSPSINITSPIIRDYIVDYPEKSDKIHSLIKNFGEHTAIAWINTQKNTSKDNTTKRRGGKKKTPTQKTLSHTTFWSSHQTY